MRILITGGFGFIGGRLGQYLQARGHQIILGTRKISGSPEWLPNAEVANINWDNDLSLQTVCEDVGVIIHAAGMNSQQCAEDPVLSLAFNGLATARLVRAAGLKGVRLFIYLSTAHVYAAPLIGTISENTCPVNRNPYAYSHRAGEDSLLSFRRKGIINGTVLRVSNAIGSPAYKDVNCWQLLVNDLCRQAVEKREMVLNTTGLQQRDFIAINDVCDLISQLISIDSRPLPEIINVGSSYSRSILAMAELIQDRCAVIFGYRPPLHYPKSNTEEINTALNYRTLAFEQINFEPRNDVNSEIDNLLVFCQDNFKMKN